MDTNSENVLEVKDKVIERVKVFDKKKLATTDDNVCISSLINASLPLSYVRKF